MIFAIVKAESEEQAKAKAREIRGEVILEHRARK